MRQRLKLSIVATLYRSAPHLVAFHAQASAAATRLVGDAYEIVLVDDGSPDDSLRIALDLRSADPRTVVVELSRNFGHHKAMMTGLAHARGDRVFLIDSDLEEDPAWLDTFATLSCDGDWDVVFGVQSTRKGRWFERWSGAAYYRLMGVVSGVDLPHSMVTARLMSRVYVDALLLHRERELDIGGLWAITGYRQRAVPVVKRSSSATSYTIGRRVEVLINSVTSFTTAPLTGMFFAGLAIFAFACLALAIVVGRRVLLDAPIDPWTILIGSVWLIGALLMTFLGIVGIYLGKVLLEVKQRPYTIVRGVHGRGPD